jgi:hypothetical protein
VPSNRCPVCGYTLLSVDGNMYRCRDCGTSWEENMTVVGGPCPSCNSILEHDYEYPDEYGCRQCGKKWRRGIVGDTTPHDPVRNPKHYTSHPSGVECIEIVQHHNFNIGNAIKYLWRQGLKGEDNSIQDLEKARTYIEFEIARLRGEHPTAHLRADQELMPISSQQGVSHPYVPSGPTTDNPCGYVDDDESICYLPAAAHGMTTQQDQHWSGKLPG